MKLLVAGDWHGNTVAARRAIQYASTEGCSEVFQVGDFGYGWSWSTAGDSFVIAVSNAAVKAGIDVYWLDGNHENFDQLEELGFFRHDGPVELAPRVFYVPRGTLLERDGHRILVIGGAYSVDKQYRVPHRSWWPQEEITQVDLEKCYAVGEVDVVLSHDAPHAGFIAALSIAAGGDHSEMDHLAWKNDQMFPGARPNREALQSVLESAKPKLWVHGHYHAAYDADLFNGTFVVGLDMETEDGALAILDFGLPTVDWERIPVDTAFKRGIVLSESPGLLGDLNNPE